jgi:hypothetical protein
MANIIPPKRFTSLPIGHEAETGVDTAFTRDWLHFLSKNVG